MSYEQEFEMYLHASDASIYGHSIAGVLRPVGSQLMITLSMVYQEQW